MTSSQYCSRARWRRTQRWWPRGFRAVSTSRSSSTTCRSMSTSALGSQSFPRDGGDVDLLLQRADVAMYLAKSSERGFASYESSADPHAPERLALLGELRGALERNELVLYYQPQLNLSTGSIESRRGADSLATPSPGSNPARRVHSPRSRDGPDQTADPLRARSWRFDSAGPGWTRAAR